MKSKHVFITSKFYLMSVIFLSPIGIVGAIFMLDYMIKYGDSDPDFVVALIAFIVCLFGAVFITFVTLKLFQWTIVSSNNIVGRDVFNKILEVKWSDVKEIVLFKFNISGPGTAVKWFVFKDKDTEINQYNGVMNKKSFITIRYSKKALNVIRIYWKDKITNLDD